jgi:hypothetical protein
MNEEALKTYSIDQLLTMMMALTNEVLEMHKSQTDKPAMREKLVLLQTIQKIIVSKRGAKQNSL